MDNKEQERIVNEQKAKFMNNNRPDSSKNICYGVDTNNRQAVEAEYLRLKKRHRNFTILAIVVLVILAVIAFDFYNVNKNNAKPMLAVKERIDNGYKYFGIGYTAIYCDNGDTFVGAYNKDCSGDNGNKNFEEMFYNSFMDYVTKYEYVDTSNLVKLDILNIVFDETNEEGNSDYYIEIKYVCSDNSDKCFETLKEVNNQNNIYLYVTLDKYNNVSEIKTFKSSGINYESIRSDYEQKLKLYMASKGMLDESNLRLFRLELIENYGRYKYDHVIYADSYLVNVTYMCVDNSNSCVSAMVGEEFSNLSFEMAMFINDANDIGLLKNIKVFEK